MQVLLFFVEAQFEATANFEKAQFLKPIDFRKARFANYTVFNQAQFADSATFSKARFSYYSDFSKAQFAKNASFREGQLAGYANFSETKFSSKSDFRSTKFTILAPSFFQATIHQNTRFSENERLWPIANNQSADDNKRAYTRLRKIAADLSNPDLEHFFLRQELRCKEVLATGLEKLAFKLFRMSSDYGISITRPTIALGCLWLGLAIAYYDAGFRIGFIKQGIGGAESMGLSFANLFSFLGLSKLYFEDAYKCMHGYIAFLSSVQTFLGVIFLFLLGLGLRNRFRLK